VALVVWVYYAAQIFFLGAEFTQVMARRYGRAIAPSRGSVPLHAAAVPSSEADTAPDLSDRPLIPK
jgi:membrane protein